jgi:uncharacterized protein YndB with AHSA1/START domain
MSATSVTQPDSRSVAVSRVFDAPRELVWQAWTEPRHMAQWFGPKVFTNPVCEIDLRVGGAWRLVMRGPDGSEYPIKGVYREIVRPERLVSSLDVSEHPDSWFDLIEPNRDRSKGRPAYDLSWTVTFEALGGRTRLSIVNRFPSTALRDAFVKIGMGEGWSQSLDKLAQRLAMTGNDQRKGL